MDRRQLLKSAAALGAAGAFPGVVGAAAAARLSSRAESLLKDSLILDMTGANAPIHPVSRQSVGFETWIGKYKKAGVTWLSMTAGSDHTRSTGEMIHMLAASRRYLLERPEEYLFVEKLADVARAKAEGKLAVNFNFQGSNPLEVDINLVEVYRRLGVGHMLLAYNDKNSAGGGCHDEDDPGLSPYGKSLVREMNRVGMVVDATHTAYRTTMDIFGISTAPVIFSHSVAWGLHKHERNIKDDQIKACAKSGGVVGLNGVAIFMSEDPYDISAPTLFRHLDYVVELVGHEHVGLGLDHVPGQDEPNPQGRATFAQMAALYGEDQYPPADRMAICGPSVIAPLTQEMIDHGYTDAQIKAILGENWMRVFAAVWK